MKIAMVDEWVAPKGKPFFGGPDSRLISLCQHLKENNEIHIITSNIEGGNKFEDYDGINLHRVGKKRQFTQRGAFRERLKFSSLVRSKVRVLKPDLVSAAGFVSYNGGYKSAREICVPSIVTVHEVWRGEWTRNMGLINGAVGHVLEKCYLQSDFDGYIAVSQFTKKKLIDMVGVEPGRIEVVYNGVDPNLYCPRSMDQKFSKPTILTICRLVRYKRVGDLIQAVRILKSEYPDLRLKIIGTGPEESSLREKVKNLKLERNVEFLGKIAETQKLVDVIQRSHVFALPSIAEGFGMVIVEAMASGIPFVASRIPPIMEVTQGGRGGLLSNPCDHQDLADKIHLLLDNNALATEKIREGTALSKQYHWNVLSAQLEKYYHSVLSRSTSPAVSQETTGN